MNNTTVVLVFYVLPIVVVGVASSELARRNLLSRTRPTTYGDVLYSILLSATPVLNLVIGTIFLLWLSVDEVWPKVKEWLNTPIHKKDR